MKKFLRLFRIKFLVGLIRNLLLKAKFGSRIKINLFRVYISSDVNIQISANGCLEFNATKDRIYISRGCDLVASGGHIILGDGFFMNKNATIVAHKFISLGSDTMLGPNVGLYDSDHEFNRTDLPFRYQGYNKKEIRIGNNVWIGANTVVLGGAMTGDNVVVGANSLLRTKIESNALYAGNPLKQIKAI